MRKLGQASAAISPQVGDEKAAVTPGSSMFDGVHAVRTALILNFSIPDCFVKALNYGDSMPLAQGVSFDTHLTTS